MDKKISDKHFPGFKFIVEQLSKCKDHQLVWSYVDWSMKIDQLEAVEIFTKRSSDELASERMRPEFVLENLENQNYVDALTIYLEYLIHFKNIKVKLALRSSALNNFSSKFKRLSFYFFL